jgi:hypothetical protein
MAWRFKEGRENVEDDEWCPRSHRIDENVGKVWNMVHSDISCGRATKLIQRNSGKGLTFNPTIGFSTMTMLQFTRCSLLGQTVSGPKINYRNGTPILFPWFSPNDFWLFAKIKSTLKGRRFQDIEDIQKRSDKGTEIYSTTGVPKMFRTMVAEGEYFEDDPSK